MGLIERRTAGRAALLAVVFSVLGLSAIQRARMPRDVKFTPNDAANLSFKGKVGEQCPRSFTIRNESAGKITVRNVRFSADQHWGPVVGKGAELENGEEYIVRVVFQPSAAGVTSRPRLTFSVVYANSDVLNGNVQFVGTEGESCEPPPAAPEGPGGGAPGSTGVGIPGFNDFGQVRQQEKQQTVCVRFHIVTEGWPNASDGRRERPTKEQLQKCLQAASGWFNGVEFVPKPDDAAPDEVAGLGNDATDDTHCINIYIVHGQWFETHRRDGETAESARSRAGETESIKPGGSAWNGSAEEAGVKPDLQAAGVNAGYLSDLSVGLRITAEAGEQLCATVGHELGHALGLGMGAKQQHLQPDDGQPISDSDRLIHKSGNGSKLSDGEQLVAKRLARYLNEIMLKKCDNSSRTLENPRIAPPPPANDLRNAGIFNQGASLRLVGTMAHEFDPRTFNGALIAEFDTNLDGTADRRVTQRYADGVWRASSEPAGDSLVMPAASFVTSLHAANAARGISFEVPASFFPDVAKDIGWRLALELPDRDTRSVLPVTGFDRFDITPPDYAIDLTQASRSLRARPGATITLAGSTSASSTFTGTVHMTLALSGADTTYRFAMPELKAPLPREWSAQIQLPAAIRNASYQMTVYARCSECRLDTSVRGQLIVGAGSPIARWIRWAFVLALALLFVTLRARQLREATGQRKA